jgi:hypothetical protein
MHWNGETIIEHALLNTFGEQGWELVSVVYFENSDHGWNFHYYFKRPLAEDDD